MALALELVLTPTVMTGAALAGRRWRGAVSGRLVGLPPTSGPLVLVIALEHGRTFASRSAVGAGDLPLRARDDTASLGRVRVP